MKKIIRSMFSFLFIACLLIANCYVPEVKAEGKTLRDLKSELEQFRKEYNENQLEKEMNEKEKEEIQNTIHSINQKIDKANQDIVNLNAEIEILNEKILKDEEEIASILAFTQVQNGESAYLEYAFGAQSFTDFIYRIAISEQITTYNDNLIEINKKNIEDNKIKTKELENKKVELKEEQNSLQKEMEKIIVSIDRNANNMLSIEDQMTAMEDKIKLYEDMGCDLDESVEACADRNNSLPPDTAMWRPLEAGYVSGWYGNRFHPIWKEWRMHSGMDISNYGANKGTTKAYAVANGRVVAAFSNYSSCGGKKIYIEHNINGTRYTTGYWHLNAIYVKVGDIVTKDTVIGVLAGRPDPTYGNRDGCSNGGHLHLEISTGKWDDNAKYNTYYSYRFGANSIINFPKSTYVPWSNRTKKF